MTRYEVTKEYFDWLCSLVCEGKEGPNSFRALLTHLHNVEFRYIIPRDENRAEDGVDLRWRFALEHNYRDVPGCLYGPCSVLEMLVALAIRCEEFMDDTAMGNRTSQWFWNMIINLGLGSMTDSRFDERFVDGVIERFLNREYDRDGKGGLFRVRDTRRDLRKVEIWYQLCWFLDSIT